MTKYILREIPCSASVLQYSWDSVGCAASRFWKPGEEFAYLWIKAWYNFIRKHEEFHSLLLFSMSLKSSLNYTQGAWVWICSWDVKLRPCAAMEAHAGPSCLKLSNSCLIWHPARCISCSLWCWWALAVVQGMVGTLQERVGSSNICWDIPSLINLSY